MDRNEYTIKLAQMILEDWRKVLLANEKTIGGFNLPGDIVDISYRAMQKAEEIADKFYIQCG